MELLPQFIDLGAVFLMLLMLGLFVDRRVWPWITEYIDRQNTFAQGALKESQQALTETIIALNETFEHFAIEQRDHLAVQHAKDAETMRALREITEDLKGIKTGLHRLLATNGITK